MKWAIRENAQKPSCDIKESVSSAGAWQGVNARAASCISWMAVLPGRQHKERHSRKTATTWSQDIKPTGKSSYGWSYRVRKRMSHEGKSWNFGRDQVKDGMPCCHVGALSCRQRGEAQSDLHITRNHQRMRMNHENELEGPKLGLEDIVCRQLQ